MNKSKILKANPKDKERALSVLNKIKDKPLMVKKMEALNELFEQVTFAEPEKS